MATKKASKHRMAYADPTDKEIAAVMKRDGVSRSAAVSRMKSANAKYAKDRGYVLKEDKNGKYWERTSGARPRMRIEKDGTVRTK